MNSKEFDFGFTFEDEPEDQPINVVRVQEEIAILMKEIEELQGMIAPFLTNLKANPDKGMIRWADRAKQVAAFEKKLNEKFSYIKDLLSSIDTDVGTE